MTAWSTRARTAWDGFWFAPEPARNLAAARILLAAHALWVLLSRDPAGLSGLPPELWSFVRDTTRWRFLIFEGRAGMEGVLQWLAVAVLVAALLGLWVRATCLLAALLLYHLAPLETIFFTPSPWVKGFTISVLGLSVMSLSPCADAWAVRREASAPRAGWEYGWPLRLVQIFFAQVYLFAGWAKLFKTGIRWVSADSVQLYILQYAQNSGIAVFTGLGGWIADRPSVCLFAAASALAIDLAFIGLVFWKRARAIALPLVAVWHLLILFSLNIAFLEAWLLLLFVDWESLCRRWTPRAAAGPGGQGARTPAG